MSADQNVPVQAAEHRGKRILLRLKAFIKRLTACKPMNDVQREIETQNELKRTLTWWQLTAIGLGAIIGSGITVLSGLAAASYAGPSVILSFVLAGIVAILAALSFSELATMMPHSGAAYTYTYTALGEYLAWFIGWNYALLYQLSALTVVVSWSKYVVHFISVVSNYHIVKSIVGAHWAWNETALAFYNAGQVINIPAIAITIALTLLLLSGMRPTMMVNLVLVVIKIIILLIFIFACCKYVDYKNYQPFFPPNRGSFSEYGVTGMLTACTYVFFAYIGFDSIATVAQEARPPFARPIAFATIASVVISALIFIGICTVMVGLVPYNQLESDDPLSIAIAATPYGPWLRIVMDLGIIAALTTVALMMLLSQIRIFDAMAYDGLLPPIFASTRSQRPWISTIISGVFCAVISGIFPVDVVGETSSISGLITYIFVHIEVFVMRFRDQHTRPVFRVPFGPWVVPPLGALLCMVLLAGVSKVSVYRFLVWTGIGQVFYFSYGFWHSKIRSPARKNSIKTTSELLSTVESIMMEPVHVESELNLAGEIADNNTDEIFTCYL